MERFADGGRIPERGVWRPAMAVWRWLEELARDLVWPERTMRAGVTVRERVEAVRTVLALGTPLSTEQAEAMDAGRRELERTWPHLGPPGASKGARATPEARMRLVAAWSDLVDSNLDAVRALSLVLMKACRQIASLWAPLAATTLVFALARPRSWRVSMLLEVDALLLLLAVVLAVLVARGLRRLVCETDPRVPVLMVAAEALDAGLAPGLAASQSGGGLCPPAECAYPQDILHALSARGVDPLPLAPLMVAVEAPGELAQGARRALVSDLYRRALELEHARLAREVAAWSARRHGTSLMGAAAIGLYMLALVLLVFRPVAFLVGAP